MTDLPERQREVAALVADAWTNKRIAAKLKISPRRVQAIIARIAAQLGASNDRDGRVVVARAWLEQR